MKRSRLKLLTTLNVLMLTLVGLLVSCNNDEDDPNPQPDGTLTADAGADQTVDVGDEVTLDGSGSTDSEGDSFSYLWEFASIPTGSTVALNNSTTATPVFTPDVAGNYDIALMISNDKGESMDTVRVVAEENIAPEEIGGNISSNTTLENRITDPSKPDYIASSHVSVNADLTIKPGVKIVFENDVHMDINSEGALLAEGTADEPIVMTGTTESEGFWQGVFIFSNDIRNMMNYVEVYYAGSTARGYGIPKTDVAIESGNKLTVTNCTFSHSGDYGLFIEEGGELTGFSGNTFENNTGLPLSLDANNMTQLDAASSFTGNGQQYVELQGSTLDMASEASWTAFADGTPYLVTGDIHLNSGAKINEGVVMEFGSDLHLRVEGTGYIIAKGTAEKRVKFLGHAGVNGSWAGIQVLSNDTKNEFDYVEMAHGGSSDPSYGLQPANLGIESGNRAKVTNSIFRNSAGYGLFVEKGGIFEDFASNVFKDNTGLPLAVDADQVSKLDEASTFNSGNGDNSVEVQGSVLEQGTAEVTWVALSNQTPYYISGDVNIESGLIINAGANFEIGTDIVVKVQGDGYLTADGTADSNISFTGKTKAPGAWRGIAFITNDVRNSMDYVVVKHGGSADIGYGIPKTNVGVESGNQLTLNNSTLTDSAGYGVFVESGATLNASGNTYSNNASGDIN